MIEVLLCGMLFFYKNKLGSINVINGWKYQGYFPNINDEVRINNVDYVVIRRLFDYEKGVIHIVMKVKD